MEKFRFGLDEKGLELKALLTEREFLVSGGNPVAAFDEKFVGFEDYMIDPRTEVMLNFLASKTSLTPEDVKLRTELVTSKIEFIKTSPVKGMIACISDLLHGKTARLAKISKKVSNGRGKKEDREMSYLPGDLRSFYKIKELSEINLPASILRAIVETSVLEITKEEVLKVHFVSVACDKFTMNFEQHTWSLTFELKDEKKLTALEQFDFDNIEEDSL
ncbi:MAG: hypothetical protein ACRCYT_02315 [Cetobacterium sp.]